MPKLCHNIPAITILSRLTKESKSEVSHLNHNNLQGYAGSAQMRPECVPVRAFGKKITHAEEGNVAKTY